MKLLTEIMGSYFDEDKERAELPLSFLSDNQKSPISPVKKDWEVVESPRRLMKKYEFKDDLSVQSFVTEMLEFQRSFGHHAKFIVESDAVIIEVYTHDVNDVTEMDLEYAKAADQIMRDVYYYSHSEEMSEY